MAQPKHICHRQGRCIRHGLLNVLLNRLPLRQLRSVWQGQTGCGFSIHLHTAFHFASFELLQDAFTQSRFKRSQFIGQAKRNIQKTAVDRAHFHADSQALRGR